MGDTVNYEVYKKEWLTDIESEKDNVAKGRKFAWKIIKQWLELNEDNDSLIYCDGSGDGGIDIAYLHKGENSEEEPNEGDTWYLVQSKYGSAFAGKTTLLTEGHKVIETLDGQRDNLSSLATGVLDRLRTFIKNSSEKDKIVLLFATTDSINEDEKRIAEDIRVMGTQRLKVLFDVDFVSVHSIYDIAVETDSKKDKVIIPLLANLVNSGGGLHVGSIKLTDLYDFMKKYRSQTTDLDMLYEKNVRKFLGNKRKINRKIEETIRENPELFGLYNNGITFVVEDIKLPEGAEIGYVITNPYIVNGCQTTKSIWNVLMARLECGGTGSDPALVVWKEKISRGIVVLKVVKVDALQANRLLDITRYTNSQNAVSEKDFIALESDFHKWSSIMGEKYNVYLEIQRGGWDARKALQKQNESVVQYSEYANAFELLKVFGAGWLNEPGTAFGKNAPFAPNGALFNKIVDGTGFGIDDLYAAYLLKKQSEYYKFGRGAEKSQRALTKYLFYMVVIDLIKEIIMYAQIERTNPEITKWVIKLLTQPENASVRELLETATMIVDDYMTDGQEYSVFLEPHYKELGNNLNSFMKWDQVGKSEESTPMLRHMISQYRIDIKRAKGQEPSLRDRITKLIGE